MMSSLRGVTKRIQAIKFALLSPDEIRRMSATKIITADTYDDDGFPIDMGLMDSHLGFIEPGLRCKTCGGKVDDCPGHLPAVAFIENSFAFLGVRHKTGFNEHGGHGGVPKNSKPRPAYAAVFYVQSKRAF